MEGQGGICFENRLRVDEARMVALTFNSLKQPRICISFLLVFVFFGAMVLRDWGKPYQLTISGIVFLVLVVALWFGFRRAARRLFRERLKIYDGVIPETVVRFTDDQIVIREAENVSHFPYSAILRGSRFGRNVALYLPSGQRAILIDTDGFSIGTFETFVEFANKKMPRAKIKL